MRGLRLGAFPFEKWPLGNGGLSRVWGSRGLTRHSPAAAVVRRDCRGAWAEPDERRGIVERGWHGSGVDPPRGVGAVAPHPFFSRCSSSVRK